MALSTLHIYIRVSTTAQAEHGTSLKSQEELGIKKAKELGYEWKVWDEGGRSSHHEEISQRPILNQVYLAIRKGEIKHLWVYDPSRLSRNDQVASIFRYECNKNGVTLYTKDGVFDLANPTDKLLKQLLDAVAEFDNVSRSERTRLGKINRVRAGMWHGGPPPFGYSIIDKRLAINDPEAKWVKRIFAEINKGKSAMQVKQILDSNAVSPRRANGLWSIGSINALLTNTHYTGHYTYEDKKSEEKIQVQCPSIIDLQLWKSVSDKRSPKILRKSQKNPTSKNFYLLRDLMFCGHCGRPIAGRINKSRGENSYYCPSRERTWVTESDKGSKWVRGRGCGFSRAMNIERTDALVWELITSLHKKSSILKEEVKSRVLRESGIKPLDEAITKSLQAKLKTLQRQHTSVSETLGNLEADRILEKLNDTTYATMVARVRSEIHSIESQLEATRNQLSESGNAKKWIDWLKAFGSEVDDLETKSPEKKKDYIEGLINRIEVYWNESERSHELTLTLRLPIVNDGIIWKDKRMVAGKGSSKSPYEVKEGTDKASLTVKKKDGRG